MSRNEFFIEKYENLKIDIKMNMSEISKFNRPKSSKNDHFMDCETCLSYKGTPCLYITYILVFIIYILDL